MGQIGEPLFGTPSDEEPERTASPRMGVSAWFHGALLAVAVAIFAWPIALPIGVGGGALGALLGALTAERLSLSQVRLTAAVAFGAAGLLLGTLLGHLLLGSAVLPGLIGSALALELADGLRWLSLAWSGATILRSVALRFRAALALEGAVVVVAVAATVAAHRDGMIARPLRISDWFWTQGVDPVVAFLAIGLVGAVLLAGVLTQGRSPMRTLFQLAFVCLLGLLFAARIHSIDTSDHRDVIGGGQASDEEKEKERKAARAEAEQKQKQKQGRGGSGQPNDQKRDGGKSPFQNDMPRGGKGQQNRPAAVVVFHKEATPSSGLFYFRHAAFSQYNGIRLVKTSRGDVDFDADGTYPTARREIEGVHRMGRGRTLVATDVALLVDHPKIFSLIDATAVAPLANPDPARFRRAYRVSSAVLTEPYDQLLGSVAGDAEWPPDIWEYYTLLPDDERYYALAAELAAALRAEYARDPLAMALAVKQYLEGEATYSFKRNYEGEDDPTAAFLFSEEKLGYCVHLAHAAAFLMRAMGLPARVSAGYAVPAGNLGSGSSLLIKQGDAHAWAEVYLDTVGWVPIEITPEKTDVEPQPFNEQDLQQMLGEMARKQGAANQAPPAGPKIMDALREALGWLPPILAMLVVLAYFWKLWRLGAPWLVGARRQPGVAYRAALDRLSAVGLIRRRGESREHFAGRVDAAVPSFGPVTSVHVGYALGSRAAASEPRMREMPQLVSGVGGEVRRSQPIWRWVLGLLNPFSWLWSR